MSSNRKKRGGGEGSDNRLFAAISEDDVHHELARMPSTASPKVARAHTADGMEPTSPGKVRRSFSLQKSFKKLGRKIATPLASANATSGAVFEGLKHSVSHSNTLVINKVNEFDGFASSSFNERRHSMSRAGDTTTGNEDGNDLKSQLIFFEKQIDQREIGKRVVKDLLSLTDRGRKTYLGQLEKLNVRHVTFSL